MAADSYQDGCFLCPLGFVSACPFPCLCDVCKPVKPHTLKQSTADPWCSVAGTALGAALASQAPSSLPATKNGQEEVY